MNITLYYIKGISLTDTPVFDTLAHQALFFSEQERLVIESGFYPPYFRNTITLDISDYDFTSPSNYLSLNFNDKDYYYFITGRRYISETVIELDIEMDTIQTYMFDAEFNSWFLERYTINRWSGPPNAMFINRSYIRENYSNGCFTKCDTEVVVNDNSKEWFIVFKASGTPWGSLAQPAVSTFNVIYPDVKCPSPYLYFFVPLNDYYYNLTNDKADPFEALKYGPQQSGYVDIYIIPFNPITNFNINHTLERIEYDAFDEDELTGFTEGQIAETVSTCKGLVPGENEELVPYKHQGDIDVIPNLAPPSSITAFDPKKVPAMLDENYVLFRFGDYKNFSEYPLYNLTSTKITYMYWSDVINGYRYYDLKPYGVLYIPNQYGSLVCNAVSLVYDLKNNGWQSYISANRCTILSAIMNSTSVSSFRKSMVSDSFSSEKVGAYKEGLLKEGGSSLRDYSNTSWKRSTSSSENFRFNFGNTLYSSMAQIGNALAMPDGVRTTGQGLSDIEGLDGYILYQRFYCDNFNEVARFYESYGYKVSTVGKSNLFDYTMLGGRYFYDYVQTKELHVVIGDRATEDNFISRFNSGLRLWHTTNGVLNTKTVQGITGFEMGQVCIYDNIEKFLIS